MRGISRWYEWRESPVIQNPSSSPLYSHVHFHVSGESSEIRPYVAPIVETCNRIQSTFLKSVDPLLYKKMLAAGIEPQIYGMYALPCSHVNTEADSTVHRRWLRLLFTREFGMHDAMILWDGLFACDPTFDLAPWICVAMLIRIRSRCKSSHPRHVLYVSLNVTLSDTLRLYWSTGAPSAIPTHRLPLGHRRRSPSSCQFIGETGFGAANGTDTVHWNIGHDGKPFIIEYCKRRLDHISANDDAACWPTCNKGEFRPRFDVQARARSEQHTTWTHSSAVISTVGFTGDDHTRSIGARRESWH